MYSVDADEDSQAIHHPCLHWIFVSGLRFLNPQTPIVMVTAGDLLPVCGSQCPVFCCGLLGKQHQHFNPAPIPLPQWTLQDFIYTTFHPASSPHLSVGDNPVLPTTLLHLLFSEYSANSVKTLYLLLPFYLDSCWFINMQILFFLYCI